jgi:hypothetical protein
MTKDEAEALRLTAGAPEAIHAELSDMLAGQVTSWSADDLRHELERWGQELRTATNAKGQPYSEDTIRTHLGHSAQFIRWARETARDRGGGLASRLDWPSGDGQPGA